MSNIEVCGREEEFDFSIAGTKDWKIAVDIRFHLVNRTPITIGDEIVN